MNVYVFVHGNPINHIDPLGLIDPAEQKKSEQKKSHQEELKEKYEQVKMNSRFPDREVVTPEQDRAENDRIAQKNIEIDKANAKFFKEHPNYKPDGPKTIRTVEEGPGVTILYYTVIAAGAVIGGPEAMIAKETVAAGRAVRAAEEGADNLAASASQYQKLKADLAAKESFGLKEAASAKQMGELQTGAPIAGSGTTTTLRDAQRLVAENGGATGDWAKVRSSNYKAPDGTSMETHAYRNDATGEVIEPKTKIEGH